MFLFLMGTNISLNVQAITAGVYIRIGESTDPSSKFEVNL